MGREVRMVPANWEHPKEYNPYHHENVYKPLLNGSFEEAFNEWLNEDLPKWIERREKWAEGLITDYKGGWRPIPWEEWRNGEDAYRYANIKLWEDYAGICPASPNPKDYMPKWSDEECTHFMMYETCSEGTPISPAFETPEQLAHWLADTGASAFGGMTASYEQWLAVCHGRSTCSAVITNGRLKSGVEAFA